jgi:Protein of unknown function (DUF3575).
MATPFVNGVNPSVETAISNHWTFSFDVLATFKNESSSGGPMRILMVMPEGRYYFKEKFKGFYGGVNFGYAMGRLTKPNWWGDNYEATKTFEYVWTMVAGFTFGYEYQINDRWMVEALIGGGRAWSMHDRYTYPNGVKPTYPDGRPILINGSAEYLPYKGGINISYRLGK